MLDFEEALVGGLLDAPEKIKLIRDWLTPRDFNDEVLRAIYIAILELDEKSEVINLSSLAAVIQPNLVAKNVFELLTNVSLNFKCPVNVINYANLLVDIRKRLDLDALLMVMSQQNKAKKPLTEIFDFCNGEIEQLYKGAYVSQGYELYELAQAFAEEKDDEMADQLSGNKRTLKLKTHYPMLDKQLEGFKPGNLITIAASSGAGKTTFGLNILRNIALNDKIPVMLLSLEMSGDEICASVLSSITKIPISGLNGDTLKEKELAIKAANALRQDLAAENVKFKVWCGAGQRFGEAITLIRRHLKSEPDCKLIMIDYVGLMSVANMQNKNVNKTYEIGHMTQILKNLAMELNVVILILAQINRNNKDLVNTPLGLNDLRDSASLGNDANKVLFIQPDAIAGQVKIVVAKNRNGRPGIVTMGFHADTGTFFDLSDNGGSQFV